MQIRAVSSVNRMKHRVGFKHSVLVIKKQLMLVMEIIAVCALNHTKHINTLYGQKKGFFFNVNLWHLKKRLVF